MYTTIVTIGRNVGDIPMSADRWSDYRLYVLDLMQAHGYRIADGQTVGAVEGEWYVSDSIGRGFWDGEPEDNYTVTLLHSERFDPKNYEEMRSELKRFARMFDQDAIALIGEVTADLVPAS